ncbi:MAG: hydroxymethylglutaryl-CoA lyase [Synergistaceae bacterium]|nr:hydroxymethylglutaryl-CoA lyase [Synergistaceae bacterium]
MAVQWPEKVIFCEVGPRDGLQNEPSTLSVERKTAIIEGAADAGVKIVEIGSFVHPKAVPQMAETDEVARTFRRVEGVEYRALVANLKGVERALASGITKVKLTVSASVSHAKANLNRTPQELIEGFRECTAFAAAHGMEVSGAVSTAFGCPFEGKISPSQVREIAGRMHDLGLTELSLSDTTGMANPRQVFDLVSMMRKEFPDVKWFLHFHNTRGMALANTVAGLQAGVIRFDGSLAGLGGCPFAPGASGNIASEDMIHMFHEMGIETGIDLGKIIALAGQLREWVGHADSAILKAGTCADLVPMTAAKKQG